MNGENGRCTDTLTKYRLVLCAEKKGAGKSKLSLDDLAFLGTILQLSTKGHTI